MLSIPSYVITVLSNLLQCNLTWWSHTLWPSKRAGLWLGISSRSRRQLVYFHHLCRPYRPREVCFGKLVGYGRGSFEWTRARHRPCPLSSGLMATSWWLSETRKLGKLAASANDHHCACLYRSLKHVWPNNASYILHGIICDDFTLTCVAVYLGTKSPQENCWSLDTGGQGVHDVDRGKAWGREHQHRAISLDESQPSLDTDSPASISRFRFSLWVEHTKTGAAK